MKKKILIRIGSLRHGGAEKVLVTFLKNLPSDLFEIDLLLNLYSGKYLSEVPDWINVYYLNKGNMITTNRLQDIPIKAFRVLYQSMLRRFPKLIYQCILKGKQYDIELIANHALLEEVLRSPLQNSKKIVWVHSDIFTNHEYSSQQWKQFFKADMIWAISDKIKNNFLDIAETEEEKKKVVRIYNPIDIDEIHQKAKLPVNFNFKEKKPLFVTIGTIYPAKGFDRLLRVHRQLVIEGYQHHLLIIGDGYGFESLKSLKKDLQIEDTVTLLGFADNPYPYLWGADYYVLSSRYEGFPTVLIEALALQKPIIATDVSGVSDILQNAKLGLVVSNSRQGVYEGMKEFLDNPKQAEHYHFAMMKEQIPYSLDKSVQKLIKLLEA